MSQAICSSEACREETQWLLCLNGKSVGVCDEHLNKEINALYDELEKSAGERMHLSLQLWKLLRGVYK